MNKLLKRTLMVGALAGCLATAAWAGNVEMDMVGDGSILYPGAADGYYETNYTTVDNDSGEKSPADTKLYFNGNGDVTWGTTTYANGTTTYRYEYDAKGNLVKSVRVAPTTQSKIVTTETYTYNEDGDLTQSRYYSDWNGQIDDYTYTYQYEANKLTVNVNVATEAGNVGTRTIVYTLNDNGDPVKREMTYQEGDMKYDTLEEYAYDEKGNLISVAAGEDDKREITTYEYNDKDLCVASTWNPSEYSAEHYHSVPNTVKYEYDENGNLTKKTYDSIYETYTYAAIPKEASKSEFKDVAPETYYSAPVIWATENEITNGIDTEGNFGPDSNCTRGQLMTFLWRAAGSPEPKTTKSPFTDVQDTSVYYYKAVLWAVENKVTKGVSETEFAPDATCTRAQIVTMIYRAAGEPKVTAENPFTDVEKNDYYDAILWAVKNGVTTGISKTEFAPNTTCTRGQGVTFLYRGIGLY